ncbi:hypothetical protein [Arabiibacter massiliensis]|uniref:hypothetical protein n=1 Tax=Arabiibacter massiliensis TaxID=1870985 RepID=UPI0009B9906C|nr:hypothetical protein [Arabiibacter massiliensis]
MLKLKDLESMGTVTFGGAENVNLDNIKSAISDLASQNQIPIAFYKDEAKAGGMFSDAVPVLVAYHPEHRNDYFNMAIVLSKQGTFGSAAVYAAGKSKQMNKFVRSEANKEARRGQPLSVKLGNAAVSGLMNMGKSKQKLQEEQMYYEIVLGLIGTALNE